METSSEGTSVKMQLSLEDLIRVYELTVGDPIDEAERALFENTLGYLRELKRLKDVKMSA